MRPLVSAFALGAFAFGAFALLGCLAIGAYADAAGRRSLELELAGIQLLAFAREGESTSTTLGPGVALAAVVGGFANAAGAAALIHVRRHRA